MQKKLDAVSATNTVKKIEHDADFWQNIKKNCANKTGPYGTDAIKQMIKTGKMTVHDRDHTNYNKTILGNAAEQGAFDLAKFLINNVSHLV